MVADDEVFDGDIATQTPQTVENLRIILQAQGLSLEHVLKATLSLVARPASSPVNI